MRVSDIMTKDVDIISKDSTLAKATTYLRKLNHSQLPVMEDDRLIGLLTEKVLDELSPSKATSLSIFEINYLLDKTLVEEVMIQDIYTIAKDDFVEDAAHIMFMQDVGSLPVIDENRKLIGILTRMDIFKAFIDMMGVNDEGTRMCIEVKEDIGVIAKISTAIAKENISISHISNFTVGESIEIVIKVASKDSQLLRKIIEDLGYKFLYSN